MTDPVVAMDGYTYERSSIERWFENHSKKQLKSPSSNTIMSSKLLLPNYSMKRQLRILDEQLKVTKMISSIVTYQIETLHGFLSNPAYRTYYYYFLLLGCCRFV